MKNKIFKKGLAFGMSAFLLSSSLAPVSVEAASWKQNKTGWWWQEDNGSYPVNQWKAIKGKWYAFDARGYMRSGWFLSKGKWYYLGAANDGSMKTGWQLVNGSWYYLNPGNGDMAVNRWIGNYYVGESGAMLKNQWIGNYYVDASGKWVPGKKKPTAQWIQSGNRWWYRHADGGYTKNGWEKIHGSWYYFDASGWMLADTWIGDYYVDASGKWVPDAKKDQHTHKWVAETTVVTHPAETRQELVKEAWTEEIPHEEEGHYEATIPGHWEYTLVPAEGYTEEYETIYGDMDTRFVVTKRAYTESTWVAAETVECSDAGVDIETPMYQEQERIICGGCGLDVTDDYTSGNEESQSHSIKEGLKGNYNCGSTYSDYRMVQYDTRTVHYDAKYVVDKEAYTEIVQHDAEYKTVVDKDAWTETITKNVCSECGAVQ